MRDLNIRKDTSLILILMMIVIGINFLPKEAKASEVTEEKVTEEKVTEEEVTEVAVTEVAVNEVNDIYNDEQLITAKKAASKGVNVIFSFTIEKPAYVYIETDTTCFWGIAQTVFDLESRNPVVNNGIVNYGADKYIIKENITYLEAGTYYIHYFKEDEAQNLVHSVNSTPFTHTVAVSAQYINRTVNAGNTLNDAVKISTNKTYNGFLSSSVRSQCYKFTIINKCVVSVEASAKVNSGLEYKDGFLKTYDPNSHSANINLYNINMKKLDNMTAFDSKKVTNTPIKTVLDPGTYYIELEDAANPAMYGYTSLKVNAHPTKYLAIPKVKAKKNGTKTIEGTAVLKSKITIYYNGKAYNTTTDSKGNFKITVSSKLVKGNIISIYASKSNNQSKTLRTKVD